MRYVIMAAVFAATISPALAGGYEHSKDPTTTFNVHNHAQATAWQKSVNKNTNIAKGGKANASAVATSTATGGAGGAGGAGGNGFGGSGGSVSDQSAPAFDVPSPASGPCTGFSGGASFSILGGGGGFALGTIEANCRKDEHIRIGLSDARTAEQARHDWFAMDADLFGHGNMDPNPPAATQTSQAPAPTMVAPVQTAEAGPTCNPNLPKVLALQCAAKP